MDSIGLTPTSTLREVFKARYACLSPGWAEGSKRVQGDHFLVVERHWVMDRPISAYTRDDVLYLFKGLKASGHKNSTIRNRISWLSGLFKWAVEDGIIVSSPVVLSRLPKLPQQDPDRRPFTFGEFQRVLKQAETLTSIDCEMWRGACTVAYYTGLRISDVADLRWEPDEDGGGTWVDFPSEAIIAHPMKRKAIRQRLEIPIEPELYEFLQSQVAERRPGRPWVLPYFHWQQHHSRQNIATRFILMCRTINLHNHSFHSFRHGFVTRLMNAGVDPIIIGSMTGQSVEQIASYTHVSQDAKRFALAKSRKALHAARLSDMDFHPVNQSLTP